MTFRDYEVFCAVYENGTITAGASQLGVSQPTVSNVITKAENELGKKLFTIVKKQLRPTEFATYLYHQAKHLLAVQNGILNYSNVSTTICRAGFYSAFSEGPLPYLLELLSGSTDLLIQPVISNSRDLWNLVKFGELDFALTDYDVFNKRIRSFPITESSLTLVAAEDYPVGSELSTMELLEHPLIIREPGSGDYDAMQRHYVERQLPFSPWITSTSTLSMLGLTHRKRGITCLSKTYFERSVEHTGLREVTLIDGPVQKCQYILFNTDNDLSKEIKSLISKTVTFIQNHEQDSVYLHRIPFEPL